MAETFVDHLTVTAPTLAAGAAFVDQVPVDGVAPALIEWRTPVHPAAGLPDKGLSFVGLEIAHPEPQRLSRLLLSLDLQGPVTVRSPAGGALPHLVAHIRTPRGLRTLPFAAT